MTKELRKIAKEIREIKRELTAASARTGSILKDPTYKKWVRRDKKILEDYISETIDECYEMDECHEVDGDMLAEGHGMAAEDDSQLTKLENKLIELYGQEAWDDVKDSYINDTDYEALAEDIQGY